MRVARLTDPAAVAAGILVNARLDYAHGPNAANGVPAIVARAAATSGTSSTAAACPGATLSAGWTTFGGADAYPIGALGQAPIGLAVLGGSEPWQAASTTYYTTSTPGATWTLVTTAYRVDLFWITAAGGALAHVTVDGVATKGWDASQAGPQPYSIDLDGQQHTIVVECLGDATISQAMLGSVADTAGTGLAADLGLSRNGQATQALTWTVAGLSASQAGVYNQTPQAAPASAPTGSPNGTGGNVPAGGHTYETTFVNPTGETAAGPASGSVTTSGSTSSVALAAAPTGPAGTTARKVYRSDGGAYGLVLTIADNITTTATDTAATLGAAPPATGTATTPVGVLSTGATSDALIAGFTLALKAGTWGATNVATVQTFAATLTLSNVTRYTALATNASYTGAVLDAGRPDTEWPLVEFTAGPATAALPSLLRGAGDTAVPDATWTWQTPTLASWPDPGGGPFLRVAAGTPGLIGRYSQTVASYTGAALVWVSDFAVFWQQPVTDPFRRRFNPAAWFGPTRTAPFLTMLGACAALQYQDALDEGQGFAVLTATGSYLAALGQQWHMLRLPGEATSAYQQRLALAQQGLFLGGSQPWLQAVLSGALGCPVAVSAMPRTTIGGITFPITFPATFGAQATGYWRWQVVIPFAPLQIAPEQVAQLVAQVRPVGSIVSILYR